jgi:hypothetical protein
MKLKFLNCGKANARINQLEKQLGLPVGDKIHKIKSANERIFELEALVAQKTSSSGAAACPVYAKDLPDAPRIGRNAAPVLYPSRPKMLAAVREVLHSAAWAEAATDAELFHACERSAWASHLKIPGMGTDAEMAACGYLRPEKTDGGSARLLRAMRQDRLNAIFGRY